MGEATVHRSQLTAAACRSKVETCNDAELLARFVKCQDELAFEELVRRHGAMVMGVCRRVLDNPHDAEDAFQATFLVLAKKSSGIRRPELLANWLYGVAYRIARKAKSTKPKSIAMSNAQPPAAPSGLDVAQREIQAVIDEELHRLPDRERLLLTLCYFQGLTHAEVADRLGWRQGSVSRRVAKARDLLRVRLTRRGLTLSVGLLTLFLYQMGASAAVPPILIASTVRASAALIAGRALDTIVSLRVAALARGVQITALPLVGLLVVGLLVLGPCGWTLEPVQPTAASATEGDLPAASATAGESVHTKAAVGAEAEGTSAVGTHAVSFGAGCYCGSQ